METLLDLSARVVGERMSFQMIEDRYERIPEPVQRKIIFHSFPKDEKVVAIYSTFSDEMQVENFQKGHSLIPHVQDVLQIGFHLSGTVVDESKEDKYLKVAVTFDRCKITSISCSCNENEIFWCEHVVALVLYRIRYANQVTLRVPISETLLQMDRQQLQKLLQYLISDHTEVLPTAQSLADQIVNIQSDINSIDGAPDPTAGPMILSETDDHRWAINEEQIILQVKNFLESNYSSGQRNSVTMLFDKVREMLKARDSNGPRMLIIITEQFLNDPKLLQWKLQNIHMNDKHRSLWEQIGTLWQVVVMNPKLTNLERKNFKELLSKYTENSLTPLEDEESDKKKKRKIFHRAMESLNITWNNSKLQKILNNTNTNRKQTDKLEDLLNLNISCSRIEALRAHGYFIESLRLSVAVVKCLKKWLNSSELHFDYEFVYILVDNLLNACESNGTHVHVPVSHITPNDHDSDSLLNFAFDAVLICFSAVRALPTGFYKQDKFARFEDKILQRVLSVGKVLSWREVSSFTLEDSATQLTSPLPPQKLSNKDLLKTISTLLKQQLKNPNTIYKKNSLPNYTFGRYLFNTLNGYDAPLSYEVGMNILSKTYEEKKTRWFTQGHFEIQQCTLASTMLERAKNDVKILENVLQVCLSSIHSSSHLFRLAQDCFRLATPVDLARNFNLLEVSFKIGLKVVKVTLFYCHRRRWEMVRWLVTCATELGYDAVLYLLNNWHELFTATEAAGSVATNVMSRTTILRLNLNFKQQEEMAAAARDLALQCAHKDPPNCSLSALTLCESDVVSFERAYEIVINSASLLNSQHLFTIARYMEHRGFPLRAYKLAVLAIGHIHVPFNQDTHPGISDIYWSCGLSHSLGRHELANIIPIIVKNVQCAVVLAEILRRCSLSHMQDSKRKKWTYSEGPLRLLLEATISSYIKTVHSRLTHISPRHYTDFIEYLSKAKESFSLAEDGHLQFAQLIDNIKIGYKGKKKLMFLIKERFR